VGNLVTDDELIDELVKHSIALQPKCCGNDEWRGRLCSYHQGFADGAEAALRFLHEAGKLNP
jgi:hypothetical protein